MQEDESWRPKSHTGGEGWAGALLYPAQWRATAHRAPAIVEGAHQALWTEAGGLPVSIAALFGIIAALCWVSGMVVNQQEA